MNITIKILFVTSALVSLTSCDRFYDVAITLADMKVEEILDSVSGEVDDVLVDLCLMPPKQATEIECINSVKSIKANCLSAAEEKWEGKVMNKSNMEALIKEYVDCMFKRT